MGGRGWREARKKEGKCVLNLLTSPSSYCLPHDRQINGQAVVGTWKSNFIWKASRWRRGSKKCLTQVRIQACFILKGEMVLQTSCCQLDPGGEVKMLFFVVQVGQATSSCKLLIGQMLFSVLQLFISSCMEKHCTFKGQSPK